MKIYINVKPGSMGGPSIFVKNFVEECNKRGHVISYKLTPDCDTALNLITAAGDFFNKCKKWKIKSIGRLDGFYIPSYWNNRENRIMTLDKIQTNNAMRRDLPLYDEVIFQSKWSKSMFDKWIYERKNANVVYNGIDNKKFKRNPNKKRTNTVLMLGMLRNDYMMNSFIGTYNHLRKKRPGVKWLIVGTMDAECKKIFNTVAAQPNIKYLGDFSNDRLPEIYNKADVFAHFRLGDCLPHVILESMACGLGIVCGSWGGTYEIVGRSACIVKTNEWSYGKAFQKNCAKAIDKVFDNLDLHIFKAQKMVEKHFTIEKMVDKYLKIMTP